MSLKGFLHKEAHQRSWLSSILKINCSLVKLDELHHVQQRLDTNTMVNSSPVTGALFLEDDDSSTNNLNLLEMAT